MISYYRICTLGATNKYDCLDGILQNLKYCLKIYDDYPQIKKEEIEFFHRTEDFSDLWSKIVSAKRKIENLIAKRRFKLKQNSKMISAMARKSFY